MTEHTPSRLGPVPTKVLVAAGAVSALILLLLYIQGTIGGHKVRPGTVPLATTGGPTVSTVTVEKRQVDDVVDWPGTVRSRSVANVAPKVMARVLEVRVTAGTAVKQGDVVAVLDDRELRSRAEQARAALAAAEAQAGQAESDLRRSRLLIQKQATTPQDLEAAEARAKATRAQAAQARDGLTEVQVMLGDTTLRAPFDGVVAERLVDPGDMAAPGKPVVVIHDPQSLRLEADVGERCAASLAVGQEIPVHLESLRRDVAARIEVIAPVADPQSRTFLVKAALPPQPDLRAGIFGTVRVICGTHAALLIPAAAVTRSGQLESVRVVTEDGTRTRNVRTGKPYDDQVEVLSGLLEAEKVVVDEARQ
jgi:RND family efflux transporter MFP subunit